VLKPLGCSGSAALVGGTSWYRTKGRERRYSGASSCVPVQTSAAQCFNYC